MFPKGFDISKIDLKVRDLAVYLNRIPSTETMTTCEGHYPYSNSWPAKDGWVWFRTSDGELVRLIEGVVERFPFTKLTRYSFASVDYFLEAKFPTFPKHPLEMRFIDHVSYAFPAYIRRREIGKFWKDLTSRVGSYASQFPVPCEMVGEARPEIAS